MTGKSGLAVILAVVAMLTAAGASAVERSQEKTYIQSVMTILMTHLEALVHLTEQDSKYSDNVVRHAQAIRQTVGLLGHMSWSPEEELKISLSHKGEFVQLAKASRQTSKDLVAAAKEWLERGDRQRFLTALNSMTGSCDACHAKFREGSATPLRLVRLENGQ